MGKKRKKKGGDGEPAPKLGGVVGTSLKSLLSQVSVTPEKEAKASPAPKKKKAPKAAAERGEAKAAEAGRPSETLRGDDRIAWYDAMSGVRPLGAGQRGPKAKGRDRSPPPPPAVSPSDQEARARLAALVGGGVRFELDRRDDEVRGWRVGGSPSAADALARKGVTPEATLDLHGFRADEAETRVTRFVRAQHRRGARRLCLVHGKGNHSEGGVGVLRDVVVHALTEGGAAPVVHAFATASSHLGGTGALVVELVR